MQLSYKALYHPGLCGCFPSTPCQLACILGALLLTEEPLCQTLALLTFQVTPGMFLDTSSSPQLEHTPVSEGGRDARGGGMGGVFTGLASKQRLLKWLQEAHWCLKDSGEGGGQRYGGSWYGG